MPHANYPKGWAAKRGRVLKRDGYRCCWCGEPANTVDHVVPIAHARAAGWTDTEIHDASNLAAACATCNYSRGSRLGPPRAGGSRSRDTARPGGVLGATGTPSPQGRSSLPPGSGLFGSVPVRWDLAGERRR